MRELDSILETWRKHSDRMALAVLATVVHVQGSSYRRPGARMLILPDGGRVGSVSGGCLEGELLRKALWWTRQGEPVLRVYDTSSEEAGLQEFGLGCNGVIHVLLERVTSSETSETIRFLDRLTRERSEGVVATTVRCPPESGRRPGERLLLTARGVEGGALAASGVHPDLMAEARDVLAKRRNRLVRMADGDYFVEWVGPSLSLVLFGAGHDAIPLAELAGRLGWDVTVADPRPAYARSGRFPRPCRVVLTTSRDPAAGVTLGTESAVVLMTHNYACDLRLLERVLPAEPRYLGLLGPRARAEKILRELGIECPPQLHAPTGLDLGADTPETIALAVAAEIQAVFSGRSGGRLRERRERIHAPVDEVVHVNERLNARVRPRPASGQPVAQPS